MNLRRALPLLAPAFLSVAQPLLAANKKDAPRRESLVAALQAVSPDPLGGRLGLNLAVEHAPKASIPATNAHQTSKSTERSVAQVDYLTWKRAKKS